MKKYLYVSAIVLALSLFAAPALQAQFSVSLGGTFGKHVGKAEGWGMYPITNPNAFPPLLGGKIRGTYGFLSRNSIGLGFAYYAPASLDNVGNYSTASLSAQAMELELNYHRYFSGDYNMDDFKFYGILGLSAIMMRHTFALENPDHVAAGELKFFENDLIQTGHINVGLGVELPVGGAFIFLEGKTAVHANAFVDNTTVWETSLVYLASGTAGVRIPINIGKGKGYRPSR